LSVEPRADFQHDVMLALGDALAMVLLEARGFQKEDLRGSIRGG
jgi:D-arabinose 5-phosphate isomerase GutQ